jgi:Spy/CpxP family protein refolding chaperone
MPILLVAVMLPATAAAQQKLGQPPNRRQLEAQVFQRFVNRVSTDMRLDAPGRARLEQHLRVTGDQRRILAQQAAQTRRRLIEMVRDSTRSEAEIEKVLTDFTALRAREEEMWKRDQQALDRMLTPRQRAVFILQWTQFNERLREMVQQRPGAAIPREFQ